MQRVRWVIVVFALLLGGWLCVDGVRALFFGDYLTPTSGPYAGQLGPWSHLVSAVGLSPRGTPIKCLHVALGAGWLIAALRLGRRQGRRLTLWCSVATLWYLPVGTAVSIFTLVCLLMSRNRG